MQECLMGIHRNLASYQPDQPIKPWISAIIRYKLADHFRKVSRQKEQLLGDELLDVTNEANDTNKSEENHSGSEVQEVLNKLPENLRRAITLTHIDGLSYSEAAAKEGVSEVALRKRISRGFSKIRTVVAKEMEI